MDKISDSLSNQTSNLSAEFVAEECKTIDVNNSTDSADDQMTQPLLQNEALKKDTDETEKKEVEKIDHSTSPILLSCEQCIQNTELLDEVNDHMTVGKDRMNKLKSKVLEIEKQIDEVIKITEKELLDQERMKRDLSEKENIRIELEKTLASHQEDLKRVEQLKSEIRKRREENLGLKDQEEKQHEMLLEQKGLMKSRKSQLSGELKRLNSDTRRMYAKIREKTAEIISLPSTDPAYILASERAMKGQIEKQKRENLILRQENKALKNQKERGGEDLNLCINRLQSVSLNNSSPQLPQSSSSIASTSHNCYSQLSSLSNSNPRYYGAGSVLSRLLERKAELLRNNPVQKASDHVHRMLISCDNRKKRANAIYELKLYESNYNFYMKALDHDIEFLKQNNCATVLMPQFPEFSETFKKNYESVLKKPLNLQLY